MTATPKTIQIFLPGGDPRGIRVAEITTRIVQVIEVPRKLLPEFLKMPESKQVALYFLVGESEDEQQDKVYVGQTGDLRMRLAKHNKDKDFWQRALILISRTNTLTQTHALSLEWQSIQAARRAGRYTDDNSTAGSQPHTPPPMEAECMEMFETGQTLLSTLGYPIFDPLIKQTEDSPSLPLICKGRSSDGRGEYTEDGFVVAKGSSGPLELVPSAKGGWVERQREKLIASGVLRINGDRVVFEKDYLFSSPTGAAATVMGRNTNGWLQWKDASGKTLDELKRSDESEDNA